MSDRDASTSLRAGVRQCRNREDTSACPSSDASTPVEHSQTVKVLHSRSGSVSPTSSRQSEQGYHWEIDDQETLRAWKAWAEKETTSSQGVDRTAQLPTELLMHIFQHLSSHDLVSSVLVTKSWCLAAFPLIWQKPSISSITQFASFIRVLSIPEPLLPYASTVRRLSFNGFAKHLTDDLFKVVSVCRHLERLTLPGADNLTSASLVHVFSRLRELVIIDLSGVQAVNDEVLRHIAHSSVMVQGLNFSKCGMVGDAGVLAMASKLTMLRRIKLNDCKRVTDLAVVTLARSCPLLLELDLSGVPQLSNDSTVAVCLNAKHLRELRVTNNDNLSTGAVPDLVYVSRLGDEQLFDVLRPYPWYLAGVPSPKAEALSSSRPPNVSASLLRPITLSLDQLRLVDFTNCPDLDDLAIESLVNNAPQLRTLTLAKCKRLSDLAVESITRLGKHLHYLHLGHVDNITDASIIKLARTCTRLRYIDLANCSQLTDASVIELAENLPKLRRIGLVKVTNVTDTGIQALAARSATLERMHLSYCEQVSVKAVSYLLNRLPLLTHLTMTGIQSFKTRELQQFCRSPPESFNAHQRASFCVFSGRGVADLRNYLNVQAALPGSSSEASTRRGSDSSTSSELEFPLSDSQGFRSGERSSSIQTPRHDTLHPSDTPHGTVPAASLDDNSVPPADLSDLSLYNPFDTSSARGRQSRQSRSSHS